MNPVDAAEIVGRFGISIGVEVLSKLPPPPPVPEFPPGLNGSEVFSFIVIPAQKGISI